MEEDLGASGLTSSLHDRAVRGVILTEYMIIAFATNGQSFVVSSLHRRKLLVDVYDRGGNGGCLV